LADCRPLSPPPTTRIRFGLRASVKLLTFSRTAIQAANYSPQRLHCLSKTSYLLTTAVGNGNSLTAGGAAPCLHSRTGRKVQRCRPPPRHQYDTPRRNHFDHTPNGGSCKNCGGGADRCALRRPPAPVARPAKRVVFATPHRTHEVDGTLRATRPEASCSRAPAPVACFSANRHFTTS